MRFCVHTLGCKVNQYDSQTIESILTTRGHTLAQAGDGCDICLINTCTVTGESARKSRQTIRRLKSMEPEALIVVCGCYSQIAPESIAALGADLVAGSGNQEALVLEIEKLHMNARNNAPEWTIPIMDYSVGDDIAIDGKCDTIENASSSRTRALLKIQDGCSNYCAYCVIPYARGPSRSVPIDEVLNNAHRLNAQGYREIVIVGIEIASYGKDFEIPTSLFDAILAISATCDQARIRLGSIDPSILTERFCLDLAKLANLCDHFHLSLQSGCDDTLRRMGRRYDTNTVLSAASLLRRSFPNCGITGDLITGFPGETEWEFAQTLEFIKSVNFSALHVFPYSPRSGTRAANMENQVSKNIRQERAKIATSNGAAMTQEFMQSQVGKTLEVLLERRSGDYWIGYSRNYIKVSVKCEGEKNSLRLVRITSASKNGTVGELVQQ